MATERSVGVLKAPRSASFLVTLKRPGSGLSLPCSSPMLKKRAVAVVRRRVAGAASALAGKQRLAGDGVLRHRIDVAGLVAVPGRIGADEGAEERAQRLDDGVGRGLGVPHGDELAAVAGHGVDHRGGLGRVGADLRAPGGQDLRLPARWRARPSTMPSGSRRCRAWACAGYSDCRRPCATAPLHRSSPGCGTWQLWQAILPLPDSRASANNCLPSATLAGVAGLSAGCGIGGSFDTAAGLGASPLAQAATRLAAARINSVVSFMAWDSTGMYQRSGSAGKLRKMRASEPSLTSAVAASMSGAR